MSKQKRTKSVERKKIIFPPASKKVILQRLAKISFLVLIFLFGCHQSLKDSHKAPFAIEDISSSDQEWLLAFIEDFFLDSPAIFTLFGSKPMSGMTIDLSTESDLLTELKPKLDALPEKEREKRLEEIKNYYSQNRLNENWKRWLEWRKNFSNSAFLFRADPTSCPYYLNVCVINVREVTATLFSEYPIFSKELGMEFDPLEMALDFENPHSIFWEKVLNNHLLQGILFGFGERNAYFFSKQMDLENHDSSLKITSQLTPKTSEKHAIKLPGFRSYYSSPEKDPVLEQYKRERVAIQKRLKEKPLLNEALSELLSK